MSDNIERTLAIIKPDAFANGNSGKIIDTIIENKFNIIGMKLLHLSKNEAGEFYSVHKEKYFYDRLCEFMSSGIIIVIALECVDAIKKWRHTMGSTNPLEASEGTIRKKFGSTVTQNATHGSDCTKSGISEVDFFFKKSELYNSLTDPI